jgi:endonuclease I
MKLFLLSFALLLAFISTAQIPSYYNNVNLSTTGSTLKNNLASKISSTHSTNLSYTPGVWNALRVADLNTGSSSKVLLLYGYNDYDNNYRTDRTRSKYDNGNYTGDWNREHVYPKSLGTPNLGTSGPGADAHHIRAADKSRNASRGSRKFGSGSGNSYATSQGYWYPGDEFRGDVARMVMYMYLRYGSRCLPKNVGTGSTVSNDRNMMQLFLQWNADDPVSAFELNRNNVIQGYQGNRNPFIDNPAFATQIWGGPAAEDRFGSGGGSTPPPAGGTTSVTVRITFDNYPSETSWEIVNSSNQVVHTGGNYGGQSSGSTLNVTKTLADGCYTFVFKDSYGDGICCTVGNGSYAFINNSTNNYITSGSSFTYQRTKSFCVSSSKKLVSQPNKVSATETTTTAALSVTVYPNPVQANLYLNMEQLRPLNYTISNSIGQVLRTGRVTNQQIDVAELPKGVYLLSLHDGEERVTKRFVKQ